MKRNEVDRSKLTPMMLQYMSIKDQYEDMILFFRLGDFYEMFYEDAITASQVLEITLTGKNAGLDERIPMCGIPFHSASNYIERLIEKDYKVAICEQTEEATKGKKLVNRDVIKVITPGTVIDQKLKSNENNFMMSLEDLGHYYSFSIADLSTGEVYLKIIEHNRMHLLSEIMKYDIKELIVPHGFDIELRVWLEQNYQVYITLYDNKNDYHKEVDSRFVSCYSRLLTYLLETQKRDLDYLKKPVELSNTGILRMDYHTKRNLELVASNRNNERNGSLLWLLDKTKTAMGSRLLKQRILNPFVDIEELEKRYNWIELLSNDFLNREQLKDALKSVYDIERLMARVAYGNANARDMLQLSKTLNQLPLIQELIIEIGLPFEIETLDSLAELLESSIVEEPPISIKDGGIIKNGFHPEIDELQDAKMNGKQWIAELEARERVRTGVKSLKVGFNKVFGYYIDVTRANSHLIKEEYGYQRKQTLTNSERYITDELKEKESLILGAEEKLVQLEYKVFTSIREEAKKYIETLQKVASEISELDVVQSLSFVCEENRYVRPTYVSDPTLYIEDGRHPVVEHSLKDGYVPNDVEMLDDTSILLITGPNMAGKSTYMRQTAIIVIMAQIGCFVPAKHAKLSIYDQIFTRIGASDDLMSGQSTFMVEMMEANYAISSATENSLILFDELGRGTATYDGMSLAQAIIEYVHDEIGAKTLFSTHYHELTSLDQSFSNLRNVHVAAEDDEGHVVFLHKVKDGAANKSYGIHVAMLAQLPDKIINRANKILKTYESKEPVKYEEQLTFELESKPEKHEIVTLLEEVNPLEMTPLDALNKLFELKDKMK